MKTVDMGHVDNRKKIDVWVQIAKRYAPAAAALLPRNLSPHIKAQSLASAAEVAKRLYRAMDSEITLTPDQFLKHGGDCDSQFVFLLTLALALGYPPSSCTALVSTADAGMLHISLRVDGKTYDALPTPWPADTRILAEVPCA